MFPVSLNSRHRQPTTQLLCKTVDKQCKAMSHISNNKSDINRLTLWSRHQWNRMSAHSVSLMPWLSLKNKYRKWWLVAAYCIVISSNWCVYTQIHSTVLAENRLTKLQLINNNNAVTAKYEIVSKHISSRRKFSSRSQSLRYGGDKSNLKQLRYTEKEPTPLHLTELN